MQFDKQHWFRRAQNNKNKQDWSKQTILALEKLVDWIEQRGYEIEFTSLHTQAWTLPSKTILIPSKVPAGLQLLYTLHEAGHVSYECSKPTKPMFKHGYAASERKQKQLNHWIDILHEEFDAWDRGLRLASRLGIKINADRYNNLRSKCIMSYLQKIIVLKTLSRVKHR